MFKDSRIFVAGHSGLLGSAVVKRLRAAGYSSIITRSHKELDLQNYESVVAFFSNERPEYVFLCAGLTGGIQANRTRPATFLQTNIAIQNNLIEAANQFGVKHVVFYGSSCIYPKECPQPIREEYLLTGDIERTSEAYAIAKTAGIIACRSYNHQYRTNRFIALVPNSLYGPHDNFDLENSHVLSALIKRISDAKQRQDRAITLWGSGAPRREFVFCEDAADASIFAVKNASRLQNTHYNIGTGVDHSIRELAEHISTIVGYAGEIRWDTTRPDGTLRKLLDSSKFRALGWTPATPFLQGLETACTWYRLHYEGGK